LTDKHLLAEKNYEEIKSKKSENSKTKKYSNSIRKLCAFSPYREKMQDPSGQWL